MLHEQNKLRENQNARNRRTTEMHVFAWPMSWLRGINCKRTRSPMLSQIYLYEPASLYTCLL